MLPEDSFAVLACFTGSAVRMNATKSTTSLSVSVSSKPVGIIETGVTSRD